MKVKDTIINKFEKAGMVTVIVIMLLRIWLRSITNTSLLVFTTLLSIYYLWFSFFIFNKLAPLQMLNKGIVQSLYPFQIYITIIMGIILSYALIAILAGFMFFPLMHKIMFWAFVALTGFTIYLALYQIITKKDLLFLQRYYYRAALYIVLLGLLLIPPVEKRVEILYKDHPEFIEAYLEWLENPDDEEVQERLRDIRSRFR